MTAWTSVEDLDRRVLAAVRFTDPATGRPIDSGLDVTPVGAGRWFANRSGLWVLRAEGLLDAHAHAFDAPPGAPAPESDDAAAVVIDRSSRYLPRRFTVRVPRVGAALTTPIEVPLCPGPALPLQRAWGAVRLSIGWALAPGETLRQGIEGALVRLDALELGGLRCVSLSDARGEALLVAPGIPAFLPGDDDGEVLRATVLHTVRVVVDRARTRVDGSRTETADPDDLWQRRAALALVTPPDVSLAQGGSHALTVDVPRL